MWVGKSWQDQGHDPSDNGGMFRCFALDDIIWFGVWEEIRALLFFRSLFHPRLLVPHFRLEHYTQHLIPNENTRNPIRGTFHHLRAEMQGQCMVSWSEIE